MTGKKLYVEVEWRLKFAIPAKVVGPVTIDFFASRHHVK
jgi:hypothetical protein